MIEIASKNLKKLNSKIGLLSLLSKKPLNLDRAIRYVDYQKKLKKLQVELIRLQTWAINKEERIIVIFEGRDAAGKGGAIRRLTERINPRYMRIVALSKPSKDQQSQWYFQRYIEQLPKAGEIVFFDRSWYNRAVVEPVMGFCSESQYENFMVQVPEFEHMLYEDNLVLIKFWFSISKGEQLSRFNARIETPLKRWKFSPVDRKGQELWNDYTHYKEQMFSKTHTSYSPWIIVRANNKKVARLECIRYVLSQFNYEGKDEALTTLLPDPNIIMRYHRSSKQLD